MNRSLLILCLSTFVLISGCSRQEASNENAAADDSTASTESTEQESAAAARAGDDTTMLSTGAQAANPDESFFQQAGEGGMAEVEAGKLAQSKGSSAAVKEFGAMMVKDHTQANDKLATLATQKGVVLPTELNAEHQAMRDKLNSLSGKEFDKAYIQGQIKDHQATIALLQSESTSGQDEEAKAFAAETLPTVEAHLKRIQEIASQAGVKEAE